MVSGRFDSTRNLLVLTTSRTDCISKLPNGTNIMNRPVEYLPQIYRRTLHQSEENRVPIWSVRRMTFSDCSVISIRIIVMQRIARDMIAYETTKRHGPLLG